MIEKSVFFLTEYDDHRELHGLTHPRPSRSYSDLVIAAQFATPADEQSGVAQVGKDKLEKLARHVGVRGDAVHRDRRAAGGCLSKIEHRAERVTGTLRQHDRAMSAHYGASRARGRA